MMQPANRNEMVNKLRQDILGLQGFRNVSQSQRTDFGLGVIEKSFPNGAFPTGAVHELISHGSQDAAATSGFIAAVLGKTMKQGGVSIWISLKRTVFPPALKFFGIDPDRIIFIDVKKEKDLLWMIEECLKCKALSAVVAELREINLTESRRLQLAVEQSHVTGLMHRINPLTLNNTACTARWKVRSVASHPEDGMPGVGFFQWEVQLLKVRNGEPGSWQIQWKPGSFNPVHKQVMMQSKKLLKTG
jgi:protein ImuA